VVQTTDHGATSLSENNDARLARHGNRGNRPEGDGRTCGEGMARELGVWPSLTMTNPKED